MTRCLVLLSAAIAVVGLQSTGLAAPQTARDIDLAKVPKGVLRGDPAPSLEQLAGPGQEEKPRAVEKVWIDGREAAADLLLAKRKKGVNKAGVSRALQDRIGKRAQIDKEYTLVPELVRIRLNSGEAPGARARRKGGSAAEELQDSIKQLMETGLFEYVEPDWIVYANQAPGDSAYSDGTLWGLRNTGQSGGTAGIDVNAVQAWNTTTGSPSVVVAVIDSGVRYTHQDLSANMWRNPGETLNGIDDDGNGYIDDIFGINAINNTGDPMDDNDHGTHCAGTIAATANGGGPHVGVAFNARIMALKFLGSDGGGRTSDAVECIQYAVNEGARILNNSWGGGGASQSVLNAIRAAANADLLFVAAAGNESSNNDEVENYPSNYEVENVLAVAAIDRRGRLASFSNYGSRQVDLGAPGVSIYSSVAASDSSYASFNGTSMATPHVSGVAALIASAFPGISAVEIKDRIMNTAVPLSALTGKTVTGGMVDAAAALGISADGVLELAASASSDPVPSDQSVAFFVQVTDLSPVINANVSGRFPGQTPVAFRDHGSYPDATANDGIYSATLQVPAEAIVQLSVNASAPGKSPASATFEFATIRPPSNDNFAQRLRVNVLSTQAHGSNVNASSEPGEPNDPAVAGGRSVWWTWQSGVNGQVTLSTAGSDYDTTLAVYTGETLQSLSLVASNDDANGRRTSAVTFNATANMDYQIRVDGWGTSSGTIVLNHPEGPQGQTPPVIVTNPLGGSALVGDAFNFSVEATGQEPLTYQWYLNDGAIPGATSATYGIAAAEVADEGYYRVVVSNAQGSTSSEEVYFAVELVGLIPTNDDFGDAAALGGAQGRISGSTSLATGQSGEPNHAGLSNPLASAWWVWTAPSNGTITFDTFGSPFDTVLAVYTGSAVGALSEVQSNDDANGSTLQSLVTFPVSGGQVYRIAVDGVGDAEGAVTLNYAFTPSGGSVSNDDFADRAWILQDVEQVSGSTIGATGELGEPNHAGTSRPLNSVWWRWIAPENGSLVLDTNGSDFDTTLAVYTGSSFLNLVEVGSDDDSGEGFSSRVEAQVNQGTEYVFAVDGYGNSRGTVVLNLDLLLASEGDDFANAIYLPAASGVSVGENVAASGEPNEPNHAGWSTPLNSVWHSWTAPSSGSVNVQALTDEDLFPFDTTLAVYTGDQVSALKLVAENDDGFGVPGDSSVDFVAEGGETYYFAVDGWGEETGLFFLAYSFVPNTLNVPNDGFASSIKISPGSSQVTGNNIGATGEPGEPVHVDDADPTASAWWDWSPAEDGPVTIDTFGSNFDTVLAVYKGNSVNNLFLVAYNDDDGDLQSLVNFNAIKGDTYKIVVDGWFFAEGNIVLNLNQAADLPSFESWIEPYSGLIPPGQRGREDDPDGDGCSNEKEWRFNTDPTNTHPDPRLHEVRVWVEPVAGSPFEMEICFTPKWDDGRSYRISKNNDPRNPNTWFIPNPVLQIMTGAVLGATGASEGRAVDSNAANDGTAYRVEVSFD